MPDNLPLMCHVVIGVGVSKVAAAMLHVRLTSRSQYPLAEILVLVVATLSEKRNFGDLTRSLVNWSLPGVQSVFIRGHRLMKRLLTSSNIRNWPDGGKFPPHSDNTINLITGFHPFPQIP